MGWTGDPIWLADVLRAEGLKVIEHDGWRQRGHGDFRDIRGVLCHHTGGGSSNDWQVVLNGRPDLKGPLAQLVLERDGTYRIIAVGVCWHAGRGSWPGWPTNNANYHVIGIEAVSRGDGTDWTPEQLDAYKRGCAAILRRIGRTSTDCVGHREYSSEGKIDPAGIDMNAFRRDVQTLIDGKPTPPQGGTMSWLDEQIINWASKSVTVRTMLSYIDRYNGLILDQLLGPGSRERGGEPARWEMLGDRTLVEALARIGEELKIPGFKAPK
ncbi:N-acetylmuramoyl-L-alanine amidase [Nocardia sp. CC227C]|uniref:peptidoglycan recognition protein family protein n=1 Tax=Nocardia sp. CC227C TaxID=3044562 RepID=UPI00278C5842|nr:N-acetylmuramoyl-L-alanine amidase [Nocardia sp. CC227C]